MRRSVEIGLAVDRKGDANAAEQELRLVAPPLEHVCGQFTKPLVEARIDWTHPAVGRSHLVECDWCHHARSHGSPRREPHLVTQP